MKSPFFSVLVLTYNSAWDKTRQTLYSILIQKNVDFELVVADDGSEENNYDKIKKYIESFGFTDYFLVENKQNKGTVKNILSGLAFCHGEYIKPISPGDFLYDENILQKTQECIINRNATVFFERACYYSIKDDSPFVFLDKANPHDVRPYLMDDYTKIKRNYLAYSDLILGASVIYKTSVFRDYLSKMSDYIKYAEDNTIIYMLAHGEHVEFLSEIQYGVWYEYMSGISMGNDSVWLERVANDRKNVISLLYQEHVVPYWQYKLNVTPNWFLRQFIKLIHAPGSFVWRCSKIKGYDKCLPDMEKINCIIVK